MNPINKIFNYDCREVLPLIDDESVDVVFTDPPFNIGLKPQRATHGEIDNDDLSTEEFSELINTVFGEIYRILKPNTVAWICCNWQCVGVFYDLLKEKGFEVKACVVWVKQNWGLGNHFRPQHEFIIVAFKGDPPVPDEAQSNVWYHNRLSLTLHPNEKPVDMIKRALKMYNHPGNVMVDPFSGVFSSSIAAKELDMNYIGCETKKVHFDTGKKRLEGGIVRVKNQKGSIVERTEGAPLLENYEQMGG